MKFLKISFISLLSTLIILCLSMLLMLGTHSGTQWLLSTASIFMGNSLSYTQVQGHFLGNLRLKGFKYNDNSIQLSMKSLDLSWQAKQLLSGQLLLDKLLIESLSFKQSALKQEVSETEEEPFLLTDIVLPFDIYIKELIASDIQIMTTIVEKPLLITKLVAKASLINSRLSIIQLDLKAPDSSISTTGNINLLNNYRIDIRTEFNTKLTELPKTSISGTIQGDLKRLTIKQLIKGELEGSIKLILDNILLKPFAEIDINILGKGSYAQTKLKINGLIKDQLDLIWDIEVPQLEQLIPPSKGKLLAKGSISGTQVSPVIEGLVKINKIILEGNKINQAKLNFKLSSQQNYVNNLNLSIDKISTDAGQIKNLLVTLNGTMDKHQLSIKSNVLANQLAIEMTGSYQDSILWQGDIDKFSLKGKALGSWHQKEKTQLIISQDKVQLNKFCLVAGKLSRLCLNAMLYLKESGLDQQSNAQLKISHIDLKQFKVFLPKEIDELSGIIDIDADMTIKEMLEAQINMTIKPGIFSYKIDADKQIRLKHKKSKVVAHYNKKELQIGVNLSLGESTLIGNIQLPRKSVDTNINTAPINGNIKIDIRQIGLITALVHEISEAQGFIKADLQLAGNISKPKVTGIAEFISKKIRIPLAGIEYTDINLKLIPNSSNQIDIEGQIKSGKEKLLIDGILALDAEKNWPTTIQIKADNFQLVKLPDIQIFISPDIDLIYNQQAITIKGKLAIPKANIYLTELPEGTKSPSDDVIIVGKQAQTKNENNKAITNFNLALEVALGDKIHIKAFGLDTHLNGKINLKQAPGQLITANGEIITKKGTFKAYGQNLKIEQGQILYAGGFIDDPGLNIRAVKEIDNTSVGVQIRGTAKNIVFDSYSSDPNLSSKDITSLLITGQKFDASGSAKIYTGRELSDKLSVGVNLGGETGSEAVITYKLGENLNFEATSSSEKSTGGIVYTIEVE
jgi:translocation and assembly module TamB